MYILKSCFLWSLFWIEVGGFSGFESLCCCGVFQHVEIPVPVPKKDEVLLKVNAASINPFDWKVQKGMLRPFLPLRFPKTPCKFVNGKLPITKPFVGCFMFLRTYKKI